MRTTNHGLGRTRIATTVLERLWADAVRRQVLEEVVRPGKPLLVWRPGSQQGHWVVAV